jgi:hypothetical protein
MKVINNTEHWHEDVLITPISAFFGRANAGNFHAVEFTGSGSAIF